MANIYQGLDGFEIELIPSTSSVDSNVLLTISNSQGEKSILIAGQKIIDTKAKYFLQAPKERVEAKQRLWVANLNRLAKASGYTLVCALVILAILSYSGAVKARVVLTGSMSPAIEAGDIIITVPPTNRIPQKGDVVAYIGKRFDGTQVGVFSHRIIGGDLQTGFIVKGDANPSPDVQRPKLSDITGIVIFTIPFIGRLLSPKTLLFLAPMVIGIWLVIDALRDQ